MSSAQPDRSLSEQLAEEQLAVEARTHRRTALVALRGELDMLTVSKVAEVIDGLEPQADGVRHLVLDLRGLTFMDSSGLHELIRQNEFARSNRHNLAVVRGTEAIERLLGRDRREGQSRPRRRPRRPGAAAHQYRPADLVSCTYCVCLVAGRRRLCDRSRAALPAGPHVAIVWPARVTSRAGQHRKFDWRGSSVRQRRMPMRGARVVHTAVAARGPAYWPVSSAASTSRASPSRSAARLSQ